MITQRRCGLYKLVETRDQTKIFYLDNDTYAWVEPLASGRSPLASQREHSTLLSMGIYCVFDVEDEPRLTNTTHLELEVGGGVWQGYLLMAGLPDEHKKRAWIVPTNESINVNLGYAHHGNVTHAGDRTVVTRITSPPIDELLTTGKLTV